MKRKFFLSMLVAIMVGSVSLAYTWPTESTRITSWFGNRTQPTAGASTNHKGLDIGAKVRGVSGDPCVAVGDGKITKVAKGYNGGRGNYIDLLLTSGYTARYQHLSEILVNKGDTVTEGKVIAKMGSTGASTGAHLHFEVLDPKGNIYIFLNEAKAYINKGIKTYPSSGSPSTSGSTAINTCSCGGKIGSEYYVTPDNTHYRVCTVNSKHQHDIVKHTFVNGKCSVCGLKSGVKVLYNTKVLSANLQSSGFAGNLTPGTTFGTLTGNTTNTSVSKTGFSDMYAGHWAEEDVLAMKKLGIVAGKDDGSLGTNDSITTEEFIVMLSNIAQKKGLSRSDGIVYLSNQLRAEWSYTAYEYLAQVLGKKSGESNELGKQELAKILGTGGTEYEKPITREKAAYIMAALGFEGTTSVNLLEARDWDQVGSEYKKRINALAEKRIFRGSDNGDGTVNINPQNTITKVEAVALMNRLYNAL